MKKTALDEDAILYQKRDERPDLERLKDMPLRGKIGFLKDYYLVPALAVLAVLAGTVYMIWSMTRPAKAPWIYIAVIDGILEEETKEDLKNRLTDYFLEKAEAAGEDTRKRDAAMVEDNYYLDDYSGMMRFQTHAAAGEIDLILASQDVFADQAGRGVLVDLSTVLDGQKLAASEKNLLYTAGFNEDIEDEEDPDAGVGKGGILPYGVRITEECALGAVCAAVEDPVIGIMPSSKHMEEAGEYLEYLLGES